MSTANILSIRALALSALVSLAAAQEVPTPSEHLGRELAGDFTLADWDEVSGYYERLAAASPRVRLERVGETTEGRDFLLAAISSERNLARLDQLKAHAALLADPRGASEAELARAVGEGVPILMVSIAMHSTETAGPQFGMHLAWKLATSDAEPWASARERALVLILPCTNPDGLDHVVEWYRATVGSPHEASATTGLYQRYAGHDNNRDWFMLSLAETRLVTRLLYREWHPTVYWDVHQQGQRGERLFVPPFRDPLNPNLDAAVIAGINLLGTRALLDLTREGLTGVATGVTFDMWWNGGNRNVPVRHNILGLLTEAASVDVASPIFLRPSEVRGPDGNNLPGNQHPAPWPGGWWRLADIVRYEEAFARSLLGSLSAEPRTWLGSALEVSQRAIRVGREGSPTAWVLPSDRQDTRAVARLVDTLLLCGIEIGTARAAFEADGRTWPAGSLVIRRDQPYGAHVKDLFEVQRYPEGAPPYDVAGWTLPLLLGVHRVGVSGPLAVELEPVRDVAGALTGFAAPAGDGLPLADSGTWPELFAALARGEAWTLDGARAHAGRREDAGTRTLERLPRVGVYAPWSGSMSEGWLRWVLDDVGLPFATVRNEHLRAGRLEDVFDVLVLPDVSGRALDSGRAPGSAPERYTRGLDPEGAVAVEEFVRRGGTLLAIEDAAAWAIGLFDLPLVDVARGNEAGEFACPGSVLRAVPRAAAPTAGLSESVALFFSRSSAWRAATSAEREGRASVAAPEVLLEYAPTRTLLSGWIREGERIAGRAAWVRADHGAGRVHLFAFSPHYRSWTQQTFGLLFRALLDGRDGTPR
ncbi:MAG TPA: M14 metallopeptidase family protein [Planctomycetota bacterium]|nr:M14 metallopeptidase family protein [Planctomycetota bacterium]